MKIKDLAVATTLCLLVLVLTTCPLLDLSHVHAQLSTSMTWTLSYDAPIDYFGALEVYDGKLYASGAQLNQTGGRLYFFDGATWTDTQFSSQVGVAVDMIQSLQVFNDRLYIGTRVDINGTKFVRVYYFDGTTFSQDLSRSGQSGFSGIEDLAVHDNILYATNGSRIGEVYQRNGDDDWFTLGGTAIEPNSPARVLVSYAGSLFAGTGAWNNQAKIWRWSGTEWILARNLATEFGSVQDGVVSLSVFEDELYAGLAGPGQPAPIVVYDGSSWETSISIEGCASTRVVTIGTRLWAGACGRVFIREGDAWTEVTNMGEGFVLDFAQFGDVVFAGTGFEGRVYYTSDVPTPSPPTADAGGPYLAATGSTIALDGAGSDPDQDPLTFSWSSSAGSFDDATLEDPVYTAGYEAGIYDLTLTVTDPGGLSASDTAIVVVYDPDGGFVTGGGWIMSPEGACQLDWCNENTIGKANFGFVSKYKKGASIPTGNTEFQFKAGNLNFHSTSYDWLVVNHGGSNAQFKGSGTINGEGDYRFMLWAGDGETDTFRIKIWWEEDDTEHVIYDNGTDQPIGGGNIVIHTSKK